MTSKTGSCTKVYKARLYLHGSIDGRNRSVCTGRGDLLHQLHPDITRGTDAGNGESFGKTRLTAIFPLFYRLRKSRTSGMFPYPDVRLYNDHTPCSVLLIRKECSRRQAMLSGNPEQRISNHSGYHIKRKSSEIIRFQNFLGGDKRDRTADLLNAIQALSQLSYTPIFGSLSQTASVLYHI